MDKTIKQLADELGVSKQAIRKHIEKLPPTLPVNNEGNVILIPEKTEIYIKKNVRTKKKSTKTIGKEEKVTANETEVTTNELLKLQLEIKDNYLKEKDEQIKSLHKLLDQQQVLTLQANKKIEALELKVEASDDQEPPLKESIQDEKKSFWARWFR